MTFDISIIGAGPIGIAIACSFAETKMKIAIIEKLPKKNIADPKIDGREIALTHRSANKLKELNVWNRIPVSEISPVKEAKVLDGNSSYVLHFDTKKIHKKVLGYLISNHLIKKALYEEVITKPNIKIISGANILHVNTNNLFATVKLSNKKNIQAPLIVAADSRFSKTREALGISSSIQDFDRVAIVCKMQHQKDHQNIAYEYFYYGETLAVLPLSKNTSSIVMTITKEKSNEIMTMKKN